MGATEVTLTLTTAKRRRPLRWITRLPARPRSRLEDGLIAAGNTCNGPSYLQNILPVLEPFFPKLLFIEDRILGRQQSPQTGTSFALPSNLDELKRWVYEASVACDCDKCAPQLYQLGKSSSHGAIRYQNRPLHNSTIRSYGPPHETSIRQPELNRRFYGEYEAMRLVRDHVAWLDKTYLQINCGNGLAISQLKSLLQIWHPNLTGADMRQSMSREQLLQVLPLLNQIFFFGAIPPHRQAISTGFSWLPEHETTCFGIGSFNPLIGTQILLHPKLYRNHGDLNDLDVRWRSRIGTILHELCHAFLKAYTCRSCPMHEHSVGARGHGRAFQILAAKIEQVATKLMDGFVDMGRYPSLLHDMEGHGRLPSSHDLEVYQLETRCLNMETTRNDFFWAGARQSVIRTILRRTQGTGRKLVEVEENSTRSSG
jgi:hypothetical protein